MGFPMILARVRIDNFLNNESFKGDMFSEFINLAKRFNGYKVGVFVEKKMHRQIIFQELCDYLRAEDTLSVRTSYTSKEIIFDNGSKIKFMSLESHGCCINYGFHIYDNECYAGDIEAAIIIPQLRDYKDYP